MDHLQRSFKNVVAERRRRLARFLRSQRWFTLYFGIGIPPTLFGAMGVAFSQGLVAGLAVDAAIVAWYVESLRTVCSRCAFHGTSKCGAQGLIAARLVRRRDPYDVDARRIRLHLACDAAVVLLVNVVWAVAVPVVWPIVAINTVGGYLTVWRRGRFHGLLFRLRPGEHAAAVRPGVPADRPAGTVVTLGPRRNADGIERARRARVA